MKKLRQRKQWQAMASNITDGCYDKTFVVIHLADGR